MQRRINQYHFYDGTRCWRLSSFVPLQSNIVALQKVEYQQLWSRDIWYIEKYFYIKLIFTVAIYNYSPDGLPYSHNFRRINNTSS